MATAYQITQQEGYCHDDIEAIKKLFIQIIDSVQRKPLDKIHYIKTINIIKKCERDKATPRSREKLLRKYEVLEENGEDVLILRRKRPSDLIVKVLPYEDLFDILNEVQLILGDVRHVQESEFRERYVIPSICIKVFYDLYCHYTGLNSGVYKVGNNEVTIHDYYKEKVKRYTASVDVIDMASKCDGNFNFILIYINKMTGYTLLKPMMMVNKGYRHEAVTELLNIFLDFGAPFRIEVSQNWFAFFCGVVTKLEEISQDFDIKVVRRTNAKDVINVSDISESLNMLMDESDSSNWAIQCHTLQWKINNTKSKSHIAIKETPYNNTFKRSSFSTKVNSNNEVRANEEPTDKEDDDVIVIDSDDEVSVKLNDNTDSDSEFWEDSVAYFTHMSL